MNSSQSLALVPELLSSSNKKLATEGIAFVTGILLLSALAQVSISLPWTPVPITGQTFGVTLVALNWGRKRAFGILLGYLALGAAGLPIFAMGISGFTTGPTLGYLVGMAISSFVIGLLADNGFTKTFKKSLASAFIGSAIVFACGLIGLSFFVPKELLLTSGLLPFIPGDILKNFFAATIAWKAKEIRR